ncbi:AI-2E family transporter [Patescibacteria group bacterium]|nr:AI-2E family transporter [Patescibacteria group bacterium]
MTKQVGFFELTHKAYSNLKGKINKLKKHDKEVARDLHEPKNPRQDRVTVDISSLSVAKAGLVVVALYALTQFVVEINGIILVFFVALLFSAAIDPLIDRMEALKIPRGVGVILIYIVILALIWLVVISFVPLVADQVGELANRAQSLIQNLVNDESDTYPLIANFKSSLKGFLDQIDTETIITNASTSLSKLSDGLGGIAGNVWRAIKIVFNSVFYFLIVLFLTYFMAVDSQAIEDFIKKLFPSRHGKYIADKSIAIKEKIGFWLRGQVLLMLAVGLLTYVGLKIIGVQYTATLALVAGITELIPVAGPIAAFLIALPVAANQSGWLVFWLLGVFVIVQQIESNILVPIIMKKTIGLNPIVITFAMLVGYQFLNILGVIMAIPVAATANIFIKDYLAKEK